MDDKLKTVSLGRRERVLAIQEMVESGLKIAEIALSYGISTRQVDRDLVVAKLLNREEVKTHNQGESLGREIKFWMQISRQAMRNYQTARTENARVGFMRVACEARSKLQKLMLDTGLLDKAPEQINLGRTPLDLSDFTKEELELAVSLGLKLGGPSEGE